MILYPLEPKRSKYRPRSAVDEIDAQCQRFPVCEQPVEAVMLTVVQKSAVASANAVIAVIVAVPLGLALRPAAAKFILPFPDVDRK